MNRFTIQQCGRTKDLVVRRSMISVLVAAAFVCGTGWAAIPEDFRLYQNEPDPFCSDNGGYTNIRFDLPRAVYVRVEVWSPDTSKIVRTLTDGILPAGVHQLVWDSRNNGGKKVGNGAYPYRMVVTEPDGGPEIYSQILVATLHCDRRDIDGHVLDSKGWPVSGIKVVKDGGDDGWTLTDESGYYFVGSNVPDQPICLVPDVAGHVFDPCRRCYERLDRDYHDQDFVVAYPGTEPPAFWWLSENWESGIRDSVWYRSGSPEPSLVPGLGWSGTTGLDPEGDNWCNSGLWTTRPVVFGPGTTMRMRFMTNIGGGPRQQTWNLLRLGLAGGLSRYGACACEEVSIQMDMIVSFNHSDGEVVRLRDQHGVVIETPYPASQDNTWHDISLQVLADSRGLLSLDGEPVDTTDSPIAVSGTLFLFMDGRSYNSTNIVDDIEYVSSNLTLPEVVFPRLTLGDTSSAAFTLFNPDQAALIVDSLSMQGAGFFFASDFEESLAQGITIEPGGSVTTSVCFSPSSAGTHEATVVAYGNASRAFQSSTHLEGTAYGLDLDWLAPAAGSSRIADLGDSIQVMVQLEHFAELDSMVLSYGAGGSRSCESITMEKIDDPVQDQYEAYVPTAEVGCRGVFFYATALNGWAAQSSASKHFRTAVTNVNFPTPQPSRRYDMISFPLELPGNTIPGVLSDEPGWQDIMRWRMFAYSPSDTGQYIEIPSETISSIEQGRAYWLITRDETRLDTGPTAGLSTRTDQPFSMNIRPGWNMIGDPFRFPVAWDSVTVGGVPVGEQSLVEAPHWWNPSTSGYQNAQVLLPFEGYWVKNLSSGQLELAFPPMEPPAVGLTRMGDGPAASALGNPGSGWQISIAASSEGATDCNNLLGVRDGAASEWDALDRSDPPMSPGPSLSVYFPHTGWESRPGWYCRDFRPVPAGSGEASSASGLGQEVPAGECWAFDVAENGQSGFGREITLNFEGAHGVPEEFCVVLVDRLVGKSVDLRQDSAYTFCSRGGEGVTVDEDSRFWLLVGTGRFMAEWADRLPSLPSKSMLRRSFPNPFSGSTIIEYDLARSGQARVAVYDVRGVLVKLLWQGLRAPGRYEAAWEGTNDRGERVGPGVYFCSLEIPAGTRLTTKILLVR